MYIVENFVNVLSKFSDFSGRASRAEYWYFILANFILGVILGFVGGMSQNQMIVTYVMNAYNVLILVPSIAVGVRRMHDVGKSGWFVLIPIYNLILACTAGESGPNRFGQDPYGAVTTVPVTTPTLTPGQ